VSAGQLSQLHVTRDDRGLGGPWPAGQAEVGCDRSLVGGGLRARQHMILAVLGDDHPVYGRQLQCLAHQGGVHDAATVVAEHPYPGGRHLGDGGQPFAGQSYRDRTDREHLGIPGCPAQCRDVGSAGHRIGHRIGIGHREDRGETAPRRASGSARHGLGRLETRLTQVGVHVDETGQRQQPIRLDHLSARGHLGNQMTIGDVQLQRLALGRARSLDRVAAHY